MPKSLRCKIKKLCYNGALTERERDRIFKALDQEKPERQKGKWTRDLRMWFTRFSCSNCGKFCDFDYLYCPNCGAEMSCGGRYVQHDIYTDSMCTTQDRRCDSCEHSRDGNINDTETCHECMWDSKYEPRRE